MSLRYTGEATMDETALRDLETWKDRIEVRLDNRQVFFLFFGSAMVACMLFVLGVIVGKRLESRGRALAPIVEDPLAALDRFGAERGGAVAAPSALTFPRALLGGGSASTPSHAGKAERKLEDRKLEETAERAPHKNPAPSTSPSPSRVAVVEAAPPPAPLGSATAQPRPEEGAPANRKLAALPRPLGAPGSVAPRSTPSGSREATPPKTLASTLPPTSRSPTAKEAPPPVVPKVAAAAPAAKPITPPIAKAPSLPVAKAAVPAPTPRSPSAAAPPPVRTAAPAAPLKAPVAAAPNAKVTPAAAASARKGFLLQLSSFQDRSEADAFARRFASENAYVVPTDVPGKGTVYRVRVGSYASLKEAAAAKTNFEQTHNVIAYVAGTGPAQ